MGTTIHAVEPAGPDALVAIWLLRTLVPQGAWSSVEFHDASWDGEGTAPGDVAIGRFESSGADRVTVYAGATEVVDAYDLDDAREALAPLLRFVETERMGGDAVVRLAALEDHEAIKAASLPEIVAGLWGRHDGEGVLSVTGLVLDALLGRAQSRVRARAEARAATRLGPGGRVAILHDPEEVTTNDVLFARGVRAVVFAGGVNLGAVLSVLAPFRVDALLPVVEAKGERVTDDGRPGSWRVDSSRRLLIWEGQTQSGVTPEAIADAAVALLTAHVTLDTPVVSLLDLIPEYDRWWSLKQLEVKALNEAGYLTVMDLARFVEDVNPEAPADRRVDIVHETPARLIRDAWLRLPEALQAQARAALGESTASDELAD